MRNIALFVVLAVLTVAALVAWNVTARKTSSQQVAVVQPTPAISVTPSPTPETGGALRRIFNGGLFGNNTSTPTPTTVPSKGLPVSITPMPSVTVGPTPVGGYTKGGLPVNTGTPTPAPTRAVASNPTSTPNPTSSAAPTVMPTPTPQPANVVIFTDNGFSPSSITASQGTMIRFVNNSSQNMWVIADNSTFDMGQPVAKNGVFEYKFTTKGEWLFHNKLNENQKGKIVIQ